MRQQISLVMILMMVGLTACETTLNEPATGALIGGGAGAGLGAIIGSQSGHAGVGTAIGAGAGALLGALLGEANRRNKEKTKQEIRDELAGQGYYQQQPEQVRTPTTLAPSKIQEIHTKYNPKTGRTFPERYRYDPDTGDELIYIN